MNQLQLALSDFTYLVLFFCSICILVLHCEVLIFSAFFLLFIDLIFLELKMSELKILPDFKTCLCSQLFNYY